MLEAKTTGSQGLAGRKHEGILSALRSRSRIHRTEAETRGKPSSKAPPTPPGTVRFSEARQIEPESRREDGGEGGYKLLL